jgi:hypothetical protein
MILITGATGTNERLVAGELFGAAARVRGSSLHFCVLIQPHRIASSRDERSQSRDVQICL